MMLFTARTIRLTGAVCLLVAVAAAAGDAPLSVRYVTGSWQVHRSSEGRTQMLVDGEPVGDPVETSHTLTADLQVGPLDDRGRRGLTLTLRAIRWNIRRDGKDRGYDSANPPGREAPMMERFLAGLLEPFVGEEVRYVVGPGGRTVQTDGFDEISRPLLREYPVAREALGTLENALRQAALAEFIRTMDRAMAARPQEADTRWSLPGALGGSEDPNFRTKYALVPADPNAHAPAVRVAFSGEPNLPGGRTAASDTASYNGEARIDLQTGMLLGFENTTSATLHTRATSEGRTRQITTQVLNRLEITVRRRGASTQPGDPSPDPG